MAKLPQTDTRTRLLDAAAALLWERSFQGAGVDELCERAGAKKGSFYHFFESKTALALAAIRRSWEQNKQELFEPIFTTAANASQRGLTKLTTLTDCIYQQQLALYQLHGSFLGCPYGNLGQEMALQSEPIRQELQRIFDQHCGYLQLALREAELAGEIPAGNNEARAQRLFALLEGAALMAKVANDPAIFRQITGIVYTIAGSVALAD